MIHVRTMPKGTRLYHGFVPKDREVIVRPYSADQFQTILKARSNSNSDTPWGNSLYFAFDKSVSMGYIVDGSVQGYLGAV